MTGLVQNVVTFTIIFACFLSESLIHYNIGLNGDRQFFFQFPPLKEFFHIAITVVIFAGLSTLLTEIVGHVFSDKK